MIYEKELALFNLILKTLHGVNDNVRLDALNWFTKIEDTDFISVIDNPHVRRVVQFVLAYKAEHGDFPTIDDVLTEYADDPNIPRLIGEAWDVSVSPEYVVGIVEEELKKRALLKLVQTVAKYQDDPNVSVEDIWALGKEMLQIHKNPPSFGIDFISGERTYLKEEDVTAYLSTGIIGIDAMLPMNGFRKQWFTILAGGSGFGKSVIMQNMALSAFLQGKNVLYITLEMLESEVQMRNDTIILESIIDVVYRSAQESNSIYSSNTERSLTGSNIAPVTFITPQMLKENYALIQEVVKILRRFSEVRGNFYKIMYFPPGELSPQRLSDVIDQLEDLNGRKIDLVLVDYGDLMKPPVRRDNIWEEIGEVFKRLKKLAVVKDTIIVTATQLKKTDMFKLQQSQSNLYGSADKFFVADYVLNLFKSQQDYQEGKPDLLIQATKHRHGIVIARSRIVPVKRIAFLDQGLFFEALVEGISRMLVKDDILDILNPHLERLLSLLWDKDITPNKKRVFRALNLLGLPAKELEADPSKKKYEEIISKIKDFNSYKNQVMDNLGGIGLTQIK